MGNMPVLKFLPLALRKLKCQPVPPLYRLLRRAQSEAYPLCADREL